MRLKIIENILQYKMEDNKANAESIQQALAGINSESAKILEDVKQTKSLNEEALTGFSRQLKLFNDQLIDFFPKLSGRESLNSTESSFFPSLNHTRAEEKGTQLHNPSAYEPRFSQNESLGRLLCEAMKHFKEDLTNFQNSAKDDNYPEPLVLDGDKYFIGFCEHKKIDDKVESTPLYGMLFEKQGLEESLYVGKVNAKGQADTNLGLYFSDLNFNKEKLTHDLKTSTGISFPAKAFYKGEFQEGKFDGEGELVNDGSHSLIVKLPLLEPYDKEERNYSGIWVKKAIFADGDIDGECEIEFISDPAKKVEYPISSYKGNITDAVFSGQGTLTFTNGDVYEGNFENGMREGKGIYRSAERDFDGDWEEDLLHGTAKIVFKEGTKGSVDDVVFDRGIPSCTWILPSIASHLKDSYLDKIARVDEGAVEACLVSHDQTMRLANKIFKKVEQKPLNLIKASKKIQNS
jgi:hypothetical protein